MRMRKLSEGGLKILVQGLCRAKIQKFVSEQPVLPRAHRSQRGSAAGAHAAASEALLRSVRSNVDKPVRPRQVDAARAGHGGRQRRGAGPHGGSDRVEPHAQGATRRRSCWSSTTAIERLTRVNQKLEKEIGILEVQSQIQNRAKEEMSKTQRDYYLREQLRQIRNELGDGDVHGEEMDELRAKVERVGMSTEAKAEADKQIRRLDQMHAESAEASVLRTYIDWLVELPWTTSSEDTLDIDAARKILDEDHYDLEHIKDRILDYLAVRKLRGGVHGPILCFLGPPGVGKTSLGRSIARARGAQVRAHLAGRRARRGRDPRPPAHLRRRAARAHHPGHEAGRHQQPGDAARRGRQAGLRRPRRSLGGAARGARPRAEPQLPRSLPGRAVRSVARAVHRDREPAGVDPAAAARPHGDAASVGLQRGREAGHRRAVPGAEADRRGGADQHGDRHRAAGAAQDHLRVHARGRPARAGAAGRAAGAQGRAPRGRGGDGALEPRQRRAASDAQGVGAAAAISPTTSPSTWARRATCPRSGAAPTRSARSTGSPGRRTAARCCTSRRRPWRARAR